MLDPGLATGHPGFESDADGLWFELCFYQLFQHAVLSLRQPGAAVGNAALLGQRGGSGEKICLLAPLGMDFATYRLQLEQVWATPARPRKKQPRPSRMVLDFKAHLQQALALEREGDAESAWTLVSDFVPADADLAHQRYLLELRMLVRRGNTEGAAWGLERLPLAERTELLRQYSILRPLIGLESESVPEGAELATAFGIAALRRRDVRAALLHFDEALRLDPSYGPAYRNRGLGAALGGDLQAALFDLDEAVARDPGDALVRYNRSKVFRRLGWYAEAADDLEAARRLDPSLS
jgi:tetratricopeptide (TPR) repeat protein